MSHREVLPIPPIETANDPVYSAADLQQRWRALMGPLGFGERLLWFGFIGPDRRFIKMLNHLPIGPRPQSQVLKNLIVIRRNETDTSISESAARRVVGSQRCSWTPLGSPQAWPPQTDA